MRLPELLMAGCTLVLLTAPMAWAGQVADPDDDDAAEINPHKATPFGDNKIPGGASAMSVDVPRCAVRAYDDYGSWTDRDGNRFNWRKCSDQSTRLSINAACTCPDGARGVVRPVPM